MRTTVLVLVLLPVCGQDRLGYDDTPHLPGGKWRVHDGSRPQPRVVTPGTKPGQAPSDAVVLFDGVDLSKWQKGNGSDAHWKVEDGYMEVLKGGAIDSRDHFGDCQLHIEWATPVEVKGKGQGRGNSGVYLMGRYEVQVLDSWNNKTYPDGQAAALYGQSPPLVNACRAPGEWQTYDIVFRSPRFAEGKLSSPARATVLHNGVIVQDAVKLIGATTHKRAAKYRPHSPKGPIRLQDHGNPVRYRNIWVRPLVAPQSDR
jgi:hypothetical protein